MHGSNYQLVSILCVNFELLCFIFMRNAPAKKKALCLHTKNRFWKCSTKKISRPSLACKFYNRVLFCAFKALARCGIKPRVKFKVFRRVEDEILGFFIRPGVNWCKLNIKETDCAGEILWFSLIITNKVLKKELLKMFFSLSFSSEERQSRTAQLTNSHVACKTRSLGQFYKARACILILRRILNIPAVLQVFSCVMNFLQLQFVFFCKSWF